jgi:hypothetical protein
MKVAVAASTLAESGIEAQTTFGMDATSEAFRILSSGLYSDKISAVLREVSCNALDAHVVAGTPDLPIEVQLPTVLDPTLRIRDFGLGLDEQQMVDTYTRYFRSDKRDSNDLIGGKGLGSKSPFCYTDSFNVTVAQNGEKRLYVAHIGARGVPVLSLMGRTGTDSAWPQGLEVSFPIKPKDISEFHTKAERIYRWFRVLPRIIGGVPIKAVEAAFEGETFAVLPAETSSYLLMGDVAYPISQEAIPGRSSVEDILLQRGLVLKAPIGAVSPTASREGLEYSPADRRAIRALLSVAMDELRERLKDLALHEEATEWLTRRRIRRKLALENCGVLANLSVIGPLFPKGPDPVEFRDKIVSRLTDTNYRAPREVGSKGTTRVFVYGYHQGKHRPMSRTEVIDGELAAFRGMPLSVSYSADAVVAIMDSPAVDKRIRAKFRSEGEAWKEAKVLGVSGPDAQEMAQRISESFGGLEIVNASSWPMPAESKPSPDAQTKDAKASAFTHYSQVLRPTDPPDGRGQLKLSRPLANTDLASIGESGRYYVIARNTLPAFGEFMNRTPKGGRYISAKILDALWSAYEEARGQGLDLPVIDGVLVLANAQPCRSLEKDGWRDLVCVLCERLLAHRERLVEGFSDLPNLWSSHENPCSWRTTDGFGMAAVLAEIPTSAQAWEALEPVVRSAPAFARWVDEFRALKDGIGNGGSEADRRQVALREALNGAVALLGVVHGSRMDYVELSSVDRMENRRFPLLAMLDKTWIRSVLAHKDNTEHLPHVVKMLQTALSIEVGV